MYMQYVEVPVPTPKKDEVLIKVEAASLSPVDWRIQQGMLRPMFPREFPLLNILYIERKNKREKRERKRKHTMDYIVLCCDDLI
jgi:hypothetical protein